MPERAPYECVALHEGSPDAFVARCPVPDGLIGVFVRRFCVGICGGLVARPLLGGGSVLLEGWFRSGLTGATAVLTLAG
jgi:hypothetical protein